MSKSLNNTRLSARPLIRAAGLLALVAALVALAAPGTALGASSTRHPARTAHASIAPRVTIGNHACGSLSVTPSSQVSGGTGGTPGTEMAVKVTWNGSPTNTQCQMPKTECPGSSFSDCSAGYWLVGVFCSTLEYKASAGDYKDCDLNNAVVLTDYSHGPNNPDDLTGTSYNVCTTVVTIANIFGKFFGGLPATPNCAADGAGTGGWSDNWPTGVGSGTATGPAPQSGSSVPFNPANAVDCPPSQADIAAGALRNTCAFVVVPVSFTYYCVVGVCAPDPSLANNGISLLTQDYLATTFTYTAPAVSSVSPATGNINGGTLVTITGSHFTGADKVYFGTVAAHFTRVSDTEIQAIAPRAALPGPVDVVVSTPAAGGSPKTIVDRFSYFPPPGYWLATAGGDVYAAGQAPKLGGTEVPVATPVTGIAATADGRGYWLVTTDGTVHGFGDAKGHGSLPDLGVHVNDIVAIAPTGDGRGYWLIGRDGGEFAFGDASYHGSLPGVHVHVKNIVGMVATSNGGGYWLVGSDGGVFAFGNARYVGSLPGIGVKVSDIRAMIPSPTRHGYVLVGSDGGAFVFGSGVHYYGSLPGEGIHVKNIVGLALTYDSHGYWFAGANGAAYAFGDGQSYLEPSGLSGHLPVVAIAST
jgi:hypothetical protein